MFANDPEDLGSIPGRVIPMTLNMVLDTTLLNTQQYKASIKGKVEQSGVIGTEKGAFWSPSTKDRQLYLLVPILLIILFNINHLFRSVKLLQVFLYNTDNSMCQVFQSDANNLYTAV